MTLYKPDSFHGNHEFKVGFDHYKHYQHGEWGPLEPVNYMLFTNDGEPYQFGAINHPINSLLTPSYLGIYGADSWTIGAAADAESGSALRPQRRVDPRTVPRGRGRALERRLPRPVLRPGGCSGLEQRRAAPAFRATT